MDFILVGVIVGLAAFYVGRTFYKQFTGKAGCSSGCCSGCSQPNDQHSGGDFNFKID